MQKKSNFFLQMRMHVVVEWWVDEGKQIYKFKKKKFSKA